MDTYIKGREETAGSAQLPEETAGITLQSKPGKHQRRSGDGDRWNSARVSFLGEAFMSRRNLSESLGVITIEAVAGVGVQPERWS